MRALLIIVFALSIALIVGAVAFLSCFWLGIGPPYVGCIVGPVVTLTTMAATHILDGRFR